MKRVKNLLKKYVTVFNTLDAYEMKASSDWEIYDLNNT